MKAVVADFNQEKALVGTFSVITNLRMDLFEALVREQVILVILLISKRLAVSSLIRGRNYKTRFRAFKC